MEHRNREVTSAHDERADEAMRASLARYQQPTAVSPPPLLAHQIIAQLPDLPPVQAAQALQRRRRRRLVTTMGTALVLACLTLLGAWGALLNSRGPALIFGGTDTTLGYLVLVLTLALKPLVRLLVSLDAITFVSSVVVLTVAGWGWWYLSRPTSAQVYAEVEL